MRGGSIFRNRGPSLKSDFQLGEAFPNKENVAGVCFDDLSDTIYAFYAFYARRLTQSFQS
jgi:hypothetical protein